MNERFPYLLLEGCLVNQQAFFEYTLRALHSADIPYMVTGSIAAMLYGEPRMTNDMDVVIQMSAGDVQSIIDAFSEDTFYVPPVDVMLDEISKRGQFNVIHTDSGAKIDFVIMKDTEFARTEFSRRIRVPFSEEFDAHSASAEDVILSKLIYHNMSPTDKHIRDIRGILLISGDDLDMGYLSEWIDSLELHESWSLCRD